MLKSVENIIFNGVDLVEEFTDDTDGGYLIINEVSGRGIVGKVNNLIEVPYRDGAYPSGSHTPVRRIEVTLTLKGNSFGDLRKKIEKLNSIFDTGNAEVPIRFTDELDRVYYGKIDSTDYVLEVSHVSKYLLTIICSDPFKYGPEKEFTAETDYFNIRNEGTAEAEPIFELEVKEPITFAMLQNQFNEYNMIGRPIDIDDVVYTRLTTILNDNCSSLVGWTALPSGTQLDTGIVGGQMMVRDGYAFQAQSYGTNPNGWVGLAIRRSLSEPVQDFRAEIRIGAFNEHGDVGSLELHLMDAQDNVVAILAMRDSSARTAENRAVIQLGQAGNRHQFVNYNGGYRATWNDFSGIIRLEREGNEFRAHVAVIEADGRHNRRYTPTAFIDTLGDYQAPIAQILVYDAKAKEYSTYDKLMNNIYIGRINQDIGIPYIAQPGDIITFDHTNNGQIYINGEPYEDTNLGSDYFTLKKGDNNIVALPDNAFGISGRYRERYS